MKISKCVMGLAAVAVVLRAALALVPGTAPARPLASAPPPPPHFARSGCGFAYPLEVTVRAGSTPMVGEELALTIAVLNRGAGGTYDCALSFPAGALEPLDGPVSWTRDLPGGAQTEWTVRVKVASADPIQVLATAHGHEPPRWHVRGGVTLYPFQMAQGRLSAAWDPGTYRARSEAPRRIVTLPNGDHAVVMNGP